jgi:murein DD-endopeptidase MepM/ murein hydrolase activator NlpD
VPWETIARDNDVDRPEDIPIGTLLLIPRAPGVAAPPLQEPPPQPVPRPAATRTGVAAARLHRGKPSATYWWPTAGRLVRRYGDPVRGLPEHGIAIAAPKGTEVYSVAAGTVVTSLVPDRTVGAWGKVIAIAHADGVVSWYAHLDSVLIRKGRRVRKGEAIGAVGASGAAAGSRLAFRLYRNSRPVNPEDYLP